MLGFVQHSLCDKWGDKNIGRAICQCVVFCGPLFVDCCCHGSDGVEKIFYRFFHLPGELYAGILFVKVFVEEVDFVFVYCWTAVNLSIAVPRHDPPTVITAYQTELLNPGPITHQVCDEHFNLPAIIPEGETDLYLSTETDSNDNPFIRFTSFKGFVVLSL